jgi:hypothetical protein
MSSFHDLMGDWLRQHPDASDDDIAKNNIRIANMIESRFGEKNMENIFWSQKAKQLLGLAFRAPGWDEGLIEQVAGPVKDIYDMIKAAKKGEKFDSGKLDRLLFMASSALTYVAMNVAATYYKTGVMPPDQKMKDAIAYATGGKKHVLGVDVDERGELPGHGRELLQLAPDPGKGALSGLEDEVINKTASLPHHIFQSADSLLTTALHPSEPNTFVYGKPVYNPQSNHWIIRTPGAAQMFNIAKGFAPFSMEGLLEGKPAGSNLSLAERFLGVRAAGAKIVAPEELKAFNERHHN